MQQEEASVYKKKQNSLENAKESTGKRGDVQRTIVAVSLFYQRIEQKNKSNQLKIQSVM